MMRKPPKSLAVLMICLVMGLCAPALAAARQGPRIPEGDFIPQTGWTLPEGRYPVHTGPGEGYARAADGKALMPTGDWVQVFGWDAGWVIVQYGISNAQMRIGYVMVPGLMRDGPLRDMEMVWTGEYMLVKAKQAVLTDDPLASENPLARLPQGSQVRRLGRMGHWAFVEARVKGRKMRGFVLADELAPLAWRDEAKPFDLAAASWGPMINDYATRRYMKEDYVKRFEGWTGDAPNAWLRLDSKETRAALETLSDFRVIKGRAVCGKMPVPLSSMDDGSGDWSPLHFLPKPGFNRGALDIRLEPGEEIGNLTIACTRTRLDGGEETLALPLLKVPLDTGYPKGGVSFATTRFTPFAWQEEDKKSFEGYSIVPATLGNMLKYYASMPIDQAPETLLSQPYNTPEARLYVLEGQIKKKPGNFGVFDVTFALEDPPPGLWLAPCRECGECSEIDAFDIGNDDLILAYSLADMGQGPGWETGEHIRERAFKILLLVSPEGRSEAELDGLIRSLHITAAFSAEKWNMVYEQHGLTTGIGPRSGEKVDMRGIVKGEGVISSLE